MSAPQKIADSLAPDGEWWKSAGGETVTEVAAQMIAHGISEETTEEMLGRVVDAMRDEFGD